MKYRDFMEILRYFQIYPTCWKLFNPIVFCTDLDTERHWHDCLKNLLTYNIKPVFLDTVFYSGCVNFPLWSTTTKSTLIVWFKAWSSVCVLMLTSFDQLDSTVPWRHSIQVSSRSNAQSGCNWLPTALQNLNCPLSLLHVLKILNKETKHTTN